MADDANDELVVDSSTLEHWYRTSYLHLVRLATLATGDQEFAEDAVQDVFAGLYRNPPSLKNPGGAVAYLRRAVLNRCRSRHRRRMAADRAQARLTAVAQPAIDDVEASAVASATDHLVVSAVRRLPARQRDVILLRHWVGLSEAEVAATLGVSTGTVKSSASRARATLASTMEDLR